MRTITFKNQFVELDGTKSKTQTIGQILSEIIGQETEGKSLKLYGWHKALQVGNPLQLDESDVEDLKRLIEKNPKIFIYVKGQILEAIADIQ